MPAETPPGLPGVPDGGWTAAMDVALDVARRVRDHGDVPIGAAVFGLTGGLIAVGGNERELRADPLAHAEVVALRAAAEARGSWRFDDCTLVVTLEPCTMCAGAIAQARVGRLVFGAYDAKAGAVASLFDVVRDARLPHRVDVVGGIREQECAELLRDFFSARR